MTTTFFITEQQVRQYLDGEDNLDTAFIKNAIRESMDIKIQPIIGTLLYNKLISLIDSGEINDSGNSNYKGLIDNYIQNALLYATNFYILDYVYVRPRNNGLLIAQGGSESTSVDRSLYGVKKQVAENKYKFYADLLKDYIIEEEALFPELTQNNKLYELNPDYDSKFGSPFVFNKSGRLTEYMIRAGIPIFQKRYRQYPPN